MSTTTESPFSLTIKVGPNHDLLTGRADTAAEMVTRIAELKSLAATMQGAATPQQQVVVEQLPDWAAQSAVAAQQQAVAAVVQAMPGTVQIEEQLDQWGNRFVKGDPNGAVCIHGPRITAYKKSKAGKPYKAFCCVNDTPFGDYKLGKCPQEYPER
jgi:hypothetical protein